MYAPAARLMLPGLRSCFDPVYYTNRYPDVDSSRIDPLSHYLMFGAREGRQPHPLFDVSYYLACNPDVAEARANPLVHFLQHGWKEGRRPNPLFDAAFYTAHSPAPIYGTNPFADYAARWNRGERPPGWLPFALPSQSYQVATRINPYPIDVIIPVYSGLTETRACVESVLGSFGRNAREVILINDCTPDRELAEYLRETSVKHGLTLMENPENLGFAASANRGMSLHPERDVVLLNSDTQTANDWLDRLAAAAYAEPRTGTVTPFSNNATICSYSVHGIGVAELDRIFREVNAGHRIELPTAVGFCMYIRRECLEETGLFRPEVFGKGYGEENDFCLRAIYKGWGHRLATDVFVYHAGETSFGAEAEARKRAAAETIAELYPKYNQTIADFMRQDPPKPYRVAVSARRMKDSGKPVILSISHDLGGGVKQYVDELRELLEGKAEILTLTPGAAGTVTVEEAGVTFDVETEHEALVDLLRHYGVTRIHIQHLAGHTLDVRKLKRDLGVPLDFSVHDYFVICPQITLTDAAGRYCGEPDEAGCNVCLAGRPPWPRLDIARWREKYGPVAAEADRVIAPSEDAADRMRRYFPGANMVAAAHTGRTSLPRASLSQASPRAPAENGPLVIAALGAMTEHKGMARFRMAAVAAKMTKLPLRFVLAGYIDKAREKKEEPFAVTGPYIKDELPRLLRESGVHIIWFPAQWPETFSYTLSTALEAGFPVIAPDMGAFPERLAGREWSWVVPWDLDTDEMMKLFMKVRQDLVSDSPPPAPGGRRPASPDFYPAEYLTGHKANAH